MDTVRKIGATFWGGLWDVVGSVVLGVGTVVFWSTAAVLASFFVGCLAGTALEGFLMVTGL